jgi:hypothetical protein
MKCIAWTKSHTRCKNPCRFLFCHKHHWWLLGVVIFLIPLFVAFHNFYYIFSNDKPVTKQDLDNFEKRFQAFQIPEDTSNKEYPGAEVIAVIKLFPQSQYQRKYIFDIGEARDKNRISLFLDANNIMVFELLDNNGEVYNVKISSDEYDFYKDMVIFCEYGTSNEFSFMQIFINNKLVEQTKFKFKIGLPVNLRGHTTIMGDIFGEKTTAMSISTYAITHITSGYLHRRGFFNNIKWLYKAEKIPFPE